MERYFVICPDAPICKDMEKYRENQNLLRKAVNAFFAENGIQATSYYAVGNELGIIPTESDTEAFGSQFKKDVLDGGLRLFRKNSAIGKKWRVVSSDIQPMFRPAVWMYYHDLLGTLRTRLFKIDDVTYCSVESNYDFKRPDDFIEIKGSQFFKVIEDYEERQKNESGTEKKS